MSGYLPDERSKRDRFHVLRDLHARGQITIDNYAAAILEVYSFKPKKEFVETLNDTFESDESDKSESDDSHDEMENEVDPVSYGQNIFQFSFPPNQPANELILAQPQTSQSTTDLPQARAVHLTKPLLACPNVGCTKKDFINLKQHLHYCPFSPQNLAEK